MPELAFKPVGAQKRRAKVILIGEPGVGKTHAALTFPNPVVIDAEGSIDWFADRIPNLQAVPTKSYADVRNLVQQVREGRVKCDTLIIDSLTSIYNSLVNAATLERQRSGSDDLRPLDWGRIKRKFSSLLDELYHRLPCNVVCVGWIKPEYAKPGDRVDGKTVSANDLVKVGEQFDGDRKTLYAFDFAFKILGNDGKKTRAQVMKTRAGGLKTGQTIEDFSWKTIEALMPQGGETTYRGMTDEDAEARDQGVLAAEETPPPSAGPTPQQIADERKRGLAKIHALKENRNISDNDYQECMYGAFGEKCKDARTGQPSAATLGVDDLRLFYRLLNQRAPQEPKPPEQEAMPL